jgi:hypothetical protein
MGFVERFVDRFGVPGRLESARDITEVLAGHFNYLVTVVRERPARRELDEIIYMDGGTEHHGLGIDFRNTILPGMDEGSLEPSSINPDGLGKLLADSVKGCERRGADHKYRFNWWFTPTKDESQKKPVDELKDKQIRTYRDVILEAEALLVVFDPTQVEALGGEERIVASLARFTSANPRVLDLADDELVRQKVKFYPQEDDGSFVFKILPISSPVVTGEPS